MATRRQPDNQHDQSAGLVATSCRTSLFDGGESQKIVQASPGNLRPRHTVRLETRCAHGRDTPLRGGNSCICDAASRYRVRGRRSAIRRRHSLYRPMFRLLGLSSGTATAPHRMQHTSGILVASSTGQESGRHCARIPQDRNDFTDGNPASQVCGAQSCRFTDFSSFRAHFFAKWSG